MLSNDNIRRINDQIRTELRTVEYRTTSDENKMAAIRRIAELKALLETTPVAEELPTRKTLLKELATALIEARTEHRQAQEPRDIFEALFGRSR